MTKEQADRQACGLAADLLHADSHQDSWLQERLDHLPLGSQRQVLRAVARLVQELRKRAQNEQ